MNESCIFRIICSFWILLEITENKKNFRSCFMVWFDMIISVSNGWLFSHRSLLVFCLFFPEIHLAGWCGIFSSNRKGVWSHLPCHLTWPTCEEAGESVCWYSVNIRLSWHINIRLSLLLLMLLHLSQGNKGTGVRCKVWAMLLLARLREGFENNHLRFIFQPHQASSILFQGCSRNCLVVILCCLRKTYHPDGGDSVSVLRSWLSSSLSPSVVMEMSGSESCSQMASYLLPLDIYWRLRCCSSIPISIRCQFSFTVLQDFVSLPLFEKGYFSWVSHLKKGVPSINW